jgi:hypothetical protein
VVEGCLAAIAFTGSADFLCSNDCGKCGAKSGVVCCQSRSDLYVKRVGFLAKVSAVVYQASSATREPLRYHGAAWISYSWRRFLLAGYRRQRVLVGASMRVSGGKWW